MTKKFIFKRPDFTDELKVYLGNKLVGLANRNEHGYEGIAMLEQTIENIANELMIEVVDEDNQ